MGAAAASPAEGRVFSLHARSASETMRLKQLGEEGQTQGNFMGFFFFSLGCKTPVGKPVTAKL